MIEKIFLIGNPNVGKSVVFSRLTGVQVISANYPGTTVGFSKGYLLLRQEKFEVIDLPGTYSLEPSSEAEEAAVNMLMEYPADKSVVINIVDATNLERNLFLTLQLIEAGYQVIVCLNMCDDTAHRGIEIDVKKLEEMLKVPVISTCAVTGAGIKFLISRIEQARSNSRVKLESQQRWQEIGRIIEAVQKLTHRHHTLRELLEDASVRPFSGALISLGVIFLSFKAVRFLGEGLINYVADPVFHNLYMPVVEKIHTFILPGSLMDHLLIGDMIGGVIDFKQSFGLLTTAPYIEFAMVLPYIVSFYFVLSILEDTGYLPRLAILLDNLLHRLGLHGFAIIPVLLGFGCNVPGILATRVLESKRERFIAATLISIGIPCVPLQAMIFALLGSYGLKYVVGVYLILFVVILIIGAFLNRILKGYSPEFLLEIPPYRFPPLLLLLKKLFFRVKVFIIEALPLVFAGVLILNLAIYYHLFDFLEHIFAWVIEGLFGLPQKAVVALLFGFFRKDVAAGLLMPLGLSAKQLLISSTILAMSFPCMATFMVLWKELGIKALIKATFIMLSASFIVGITLNIIIR
ncbi:MAG: ferrous iron transporter B [Candidatus Omnitrophica bacterium]|jgi:ferrous iron transport protein B|nr:ferrous iron transporter B [Candidatus Omnitrophota bacterium]